MNMSREKRIALLVAFGVHFAALSLAALIHLQAPMRDEKDLLLLLETPVKLDVPDVRSRRNSESSITPPSARIPQHSVPRAATERSEETAVVIVEPDVEIVDTAKVWRLPKSVLDPDISPEQAWDELTKLLEEYPQYKDMVIREMLAGSGFVRDSLPPLSFHLDDVLKFEKFLPSWMYEAMRVQSQYGGYSPVMGHRRVEQYTGPQINVLGALKFLYDLINGE